MAIRVIDDTKLQNIAVAIQSKDNGGQMTVDEMPGRIEAIPTGSPTVLNPALVLWDWEGTKLAEYSREDALALIALPSPSSLPMYTAVDHELLVFQEWNWNLADIKTWINEHKNIALDVGAIYTTTDGHNYNYWANPRLSDIKEVSAIKMAETTVGGSKFYLFHNLKKINIPVGVNTIGNEAFQGNYNLDCIILPNGITEIGLNSFRNCHSLNKLIFNQCSLKSIKNRAFYNCYALSDFVIPEGVEYIYYETFLSCVSLLKINLPTSLLSIWNSAFANCTSLCDILCTGKPKLSDVNALSGLPSNYRIYVPINNLQWFETETNWSSIYSQGHIVAIEDYIEYLESLGFDVDKYKEVTV